MTISARFTRSPTRHQHHTPARSTTLLTSHHPDQMTNAHPDPRIGIARTAARRRELSTNMFIIDAQVSTLATANSRQPVTAHTTHVSRHMSQRLLLLLTAHCTHLTGHSSLESRLSSVETRARRENQIKNHVSSRTGTRYTVQRTYIYIVIDHTS